MVGTQKFDGGASAPVGPSVATPLYRTSSICSSVISKLCIGVFFKQVDILISKNQALQIYLKHHDNH